MKNQGFLGGKTNQRRRPSEAGASLQALERQASQDQTQPGSVLATNVAQLALLLTDPTTAPSPRIAFTPAGSVLELRLAGLGEMSEKNRVANVPLLSITISNPPTQAEVQSVANKIDTLITAMITAEHMNP